MTTEAAGRSLVIDRSPAIAYRLRWLAVLFDVLAFGVGFAWDRRWHATHPFEDFFRPPHLFVHSMHFLATLTLMWITFRPDPRAQFGRAFRLFPFPFAVPGAIAIAGGGFVVTGIAGAFDAIRHSTLGLDETARSFPHSMLGRGIFVAFVGIVACRVALADRTPIGWPSALIFGFLLIAASIERVPGPFRNNINIGELEFIRRIPVLAAEPAFQHTIRIYEAYDITRLNVLFVPLAAMGAGLGIRLLQRFDPRPVTLVALTALVSYTSPWVPYIVPGAIFAVAGRRVTSWRWLAAAGFAFGLVAAIISLAISKGAELPLFGAPVAMLTFAIGAWLADKVWTVVADPQRERVLALVVIAGVCVPAVTGALDLYLRASTP